MHASTTEETSPAPIPPEPATFAQKLGEHGLQLCRGETRTLQINVGLLCDLSCRHCHLNAGPGRQEVMDRATMAEVAAFAARGRFPVIDITGGAPELVPHLGEFLGRFAPLTDRLLLRSNLTALDGAAREALLRRCVELGVTIVASLPSLSPGQAEAQRGAGILERSLAMLRRLNALGYGGEGSSLQLDLVVNPTGAFLPPGQQAVERRFKADLARRWGIDVNHVFAFANTPLGRYRRWLEQSGNYPPYMRKLVDNFNPATFEGLMCRSLLSVAWDGTLYDCDFNLAAALPLGGSRRHVSALDAPPPPGTAIATGEHCYACTAGAGFT